MKKYLLYIITIIAVLIPLNIKAVKISETSITGDTSKTVGEQFTLNYKINFSDLQARSDKTTGIAIVLFDIVYDDKVFLISDYSAQDFESQLYYNEQSNSYFLLSVVSGGEQNSAKHCADGELYCSNYSSTIKFFVLKSQAMSSEIKIGNPSAILLDISDQEVLSLLTELSNENIESQKASEIVGKLLSKSDIINSNSIKIHKININQTTQPVVEPPKSATVKKDNSISKVTNKPTTGNSGTIQQKQIKSSNTNLKSLEVVNYKLNFSKIKKEYTVYIEEGVNTLNIKAITEDNKASYKVFGADDLKANNYKINIEVTAEDKSKDTYTINIKKEGELQKRLQEKMNKEDKTEISKDKKSKFSKNIIINISIGIGLLVLIVITVIIINKIKNKKIDKALEDI